MRKADKVGVLAAIGSCGIAALVLSNTQNGRMAQGGAFWELCAFGMFVYAGVRGARWWFAGPVIVILFWVAAAHIPALW